MPPVTRVSVCDATIADVLQRERDGDRTLGMSEPLARYTLEQLQDHGREDDDALKAYDLIHNRATHGRAF